MTDKQDALRPATLKDLEAMLAQADRPAEREKLVAAPEDALRQAGLIATPDAVEFLRSLGQASFDEAGQAAKPAHDPLKGGAGEM